MKSQKEAQLEARRAEPVGEPAAAAADSTMPNVPTPVAGITINSDDEFDEAGDSFEAAAKQLEQDTADAVLSRPCFQEGAPQQQSSVVHPQV